MFHIGFIPVVAVSAAIGSKLYRMALVEPPMGPLIESYLQSCAYSKENPFYGFICVIEPFFRELVSNEIGKSFLTAFGTSGMVMSTHLFIEGGRHSSSALFSPLVTAAQSLAGQVFGAGIVGPVILPARLALSKTFEPVGAPSPGPPPFLYTVTLLAMQFVVFSLSMSLTALPVSHAAWPYANYAFQGFPLLFIPLALLPRGKPSTPTNTGTSPPTIAITVFTVLKYLYAPLWWITVAQGLNAYYRENEVFSLPCYFMALDFAGFVFTFVAMYAVDAVAGDTKDTMSVAGLIVRMLLRGPASTMASYYEAKEKRAVERTGIKAKTL